jgi:hypothetical protein
MTEDHVAAVEWLETIYHDRLNKMPHPNQHGLYSMKVDSVQETPGQDSVRWPDQQGFRRLSLAGCEREPERWFIEFFFRGWHDDIAAQTPEATQLRTSASATGDGVRECGGHAEGQVQETVVLAARREESVVLV